MKQKAKEHEAFSLPGMSRLFLLVGSSELASISAGTMSPMLLRTGPQRSRRSGDGAIRARLRSLNIG